MPAKKVAPEGAILFSPGRVLLTRGAMKALAAAGQVPSHFLERHICGHWGNVDAHDTNANNQAMKTGLRLLSSYEMNGGETIWVITKAIDIQAGYSPSIVSSQRFCCPANTERGSGRHVAAT